MYQSQYRAIEKQGPVTTASTPQAVTAFSNTPLMQRRQREQGELIVQRNMSGNMDQRVNGISHREDGAFSQMYGFSLHDAGVSVKHTTPSDPALTAVGARSLIQGNQIICGDQQDLWHEYAHLPQQLSGAVVATDTINGQAVNTESKWESLADADGAQMKRIADGL